MPRSNARACVRTEAPVPVPVSILGGFYLACVAFGDWLSAVTAAAPLMPSPEASAAGDDDGASSSALQIESSELRHDPARDAAAAAP